MRWVFRRLRQDDGMATAEYAVVMLAAVGFGLLLYKLLTGPNAAAALGRIIQTALTAAL